MSQDVASSPGCLTNANAWGGSACTGPTCASVPTLSALTNATWDQRLPTLTFSSTAYGAAGTMISLAEVVVPDDASDLYWATTVTTATVVHVECGALATLTCDDR